jgi:large subunit ribosomal protein L1
MGKQRTVLIQGDVIKKPVTAEAQKEAKTQKEEKKEKKKEKKEKKREEVKVKEREKKKKEEKATEGKKIIPKIKQRSKNYKQAQNLIEKNKLYSIDEALDLLKKLPKNNFDSSVEVHIKLAVTSDQKVRSLLIMPHNIGKTKKILVFASDQKEKEAKKADADYVGGEELALKIQKGFSDFDIVISTPDMMPKIGKLGKYLGQKGLMPNPKSGTVTQDVGKLVKEFKGGKIEIKSDDYGIVHQMIGKLSLDNKKLKENFKTLMDAIISCKPAKTKGEYIQSITLCSTHSPGIKIHWP